MNTVLKQSRVSKPSARPATVQLPRISGWLETVVIAAGIMFNRPSLRSYAYLTTELSRVSVVLSHLSRHGLVIALALTVFGLALAQTTHSTGYPTRG